MTRNELEVQRKSNEEKIKLGNVLDALGRTQHWKTLIHKFLFETEVQRLGMLMGDPTLDDRQRKAVEEQLKVISGFRHMLHSIIVQANTADETIKQIDEALLEDANEPKEEVYQ